MFDLAKLKDELHTEIAKINFRLEDVEFVKENGYKILRVILDNSAKLEDTALVTDKINPIIDKYNEELGLDMDFLDVCSIGLESNYEWEDLVNLTNEYLFVELNHAHPATKSEFLKGDFIAFDGEVLTIRLNLKGRMKNVDLTKNEIISIQRDFKI